MPSWKSESLISGSTNKRAAKPGKECFMFDLSGKTAVVTGAGRGIGKAIAGALYEQGAFVVFADIKGNDAASAAAEFDCSGSRSVSVQTDVTDYDSVVRMKDLVTGRTGSIDILVNNAGWDRIRPFMKTTPEFWDHVISVNYKGVLNTVRVVGGTMAEHNRGRIINIASDAALVGSMGEAAYSGAKGAVISFSKSMARELARNGVTVNVVSPGPAETPLIDDMKAADDFAGKVLGNIDRAIPLKRMARPEDIAPAVVFFASEEAGYITGQVLSVSGGLTMSS